MIDREHNIPDATQKLAPFLDANQSGYQGFRRRAVLGKTNDQWSLVACAVEAITADGGKVDVVGSRYYPQVVLHEDWLSSDELLEFVGQVNEGCVNLGEHNLSATEPHRQWNRDQVPSRNIYMNRAGQVFSTRFDRSNTSIYGALLAPDQPYYPDIAEAGRDWLPFTVYHGSSDARNGEVFLLLPETRASLHEVTLEGEMLHVLIRGTRSKELTLLLKGAWWDDDGIHHFNANISTGSGQVRIPTTAARVEFVLTDETGTIYDYMREDNYRHQGIGRDRLTNANTGLVQMVREACQAGEGLHIEFKPFIELESRKNNEKLKEIVKTVVAYANAKGGRIFLGINDDCELQGIDEQLSKSVAGVADSDTCDKYLGILRGRIRDVVVGETKLSFKYTVVDGHLVAIIEVAEAREKPVCIRQDHYLYVRRGSSNTKASPDEWKNILGTNQLQWPNLRS